MVLAEIDDGVKLGALGFNPGIWNDARVPWVKGLLAGVEYLEASSILPNSGWRFSTKDAEVPTLGANGDGIELDG